MLNTRDLANTKRKLPDGWRWVRLGEVCEIIAGQSPPGESYRKKSEGLPFFQGKADFGPRHPVARTWCIAPTKIALPGDILISVRAPVGPINIADVECCIGRGLAAIRPGNQADRDFILAVLQFYEGTLVELGSGSTFEAIRRDDLELLEIPLPPFAEQKRIAAILNEQMAAVERAKTAAESQLEAATSLPAAYLHTTFNSSEAQQWPRKRLGDHVTKVGSGVTPLGGQAAYPRSGIPLIRSQNVHMNRFVHDGLAFISAQQNAEMEGSLVQQGDVLLNITGASIGRVCVVPPELCPTNVNQHVSIIRGDSSFDPAFLSFFISTSEFQKFIWDSQAGATRQALTKAMIEDFQIPLPSLIEQQRIAMTLNEQMAAAEKVRKSLEEQLDTINKLPAALLRQAFNGEL